MIFFYAPVFARAEGPPSASGQEEAPGVDITPAGNEAESGEKGIADPFEKWNRFVFSFNDRFYFWLLKPVSRVYGKVVPEWGRVRARNVFNNVNMPVRFINSLLQLKTKAAVRELGRFLVNTTGGMGGMFDVAGKNPGAKGSDEDLGQTLAVYGVGNGFYIVWPFLGPSCLRDTVGTAGDLFLDPVNYISGTEAVFAVHAYEHVNNTSLKIGEYEDLKESSLDPYVAVRDAYTQYRTNKAKGRNHDF